MLTRMRSGVVGGLALAVLGSSVARASSVLEVPDHGAEQLARGGAWMARGSGPLAAFYAPALLAGQASGLYLGSAATFRQACFHRVKAAGDSTRDAALPDGTYPEVCKDGAPFFNPQGALTWRVSPRVGLGLALLGPAATGSTTFPDFVSGPNGPDPSPQRYLLLSSASLLLFPTLAAGWEALPGLRVGASFQWGIAHLRLSNASLALNQSNLRASDADIKSEVEATQAFIPPE
jgi:hypothetical protein